MILTAAILLSQRRKEAHIMGLYFALLFVSPPAPAIIPGLGIIDHVWVIDHYRLLALTLLLPAAIVLTQKKTTAPIGSSSVDILLLGYVLLLCVLAFREGNITSSMRANLSILVDVLLPYYVASRSIKDKEAFRHAASGFVIGAMILSLVLIFEVLQHWKLYHSVLGALGLNPNMFGGYLLRSGLLRPNATVGNSIVAGYVVVVGLGLFLFIKQYVSNRIYRVLGAALLFGGVVASLSRGPWVGAALLVLVFIATGPQALKKLSILVAFGLSGLAVLPMHPKGQMLVDLLPIIGEAEQGNVEYRADLLTAALPVIERHLLLGSEDYLDAPELQVMRQGEGIIDLVNSYIGVALDSGMIGLSLFLFIFTSAALQTKRGAAALTRLDPEAAILGRTLFATIIAIAFIIYTVSSIIAVATVYWGIIGVASAYGIYAKQFLNSMSRTVSR